MWDFASTLANTVTGTEPKNEESLSGEIKNELTMEDMKVRSEEQISQIGMLKGMVLEKENTIDKLNSEQKKLTMDFSKFKLKAKSQIQSLSKQVDKAHQSAMDSVERCSVGSDESVTSEMSSVSTLTEVDQKTRAKLTLVRKQLKMKDTKMKKLNEDLESTLKKIEVKEKIIKEREEEYLKEKDGLEKEVTELKIRLKTDDDQETAFKKLKTQLDDMVTQMAYKDSKILSLINQLTEGEGGALDLKEMLSEKDEVIKGRDQAVSILRASLQESSKKDEKLQATVDKMKWKIDDLEEELNAYKKENSSANEITPPNLNVNLSVTQFTMKTNTTDTKTSTYATERTNKLEGETELEEVTEMREQFSELIRQENDKFEAIKMSYDVKINEMEEVMLTLKENLKSKEVANIEERKELEERVMMLSAKLQEKNDSEKAGKFAKFRALAGSKIKALEIQIQKHTLENEELSGMKTRIVELEDEKGSLQLQLIEYEGRSIANNQEDKGIDKNKDKIPDTEENKEELIKMNERILKMKEDSLKLEKDLCEIRQEVADKREELIICRNELSKSHLSLETLTKTLVEKELEIKKININNDKYFQQIKSYTETIELSNVETSRNSKESSCRDEEKKDLLKKLESLNSQNLILTKELKNQQNNLEECEMAVCLKSESQETLRESISTITPSSSPTFFSPPEPASENVKKSTKSTRRIKKFQNLKKEETKDEKDLEKEIEKYKKEVEEWSIKMEVMSKEQETLKAISCSHELFQQQKAQETIIYQKKIEELNTNVKMKSDLLESLTIKYNDFKDIEDKLQNELSVLSKVSATSKEHYEKEIKDLKIELLNSSQKVNEIISEKEKMTVEMSEELEATFEKLKSQHHEMKVVMKEKETLSGKLVEMSGKLVEMSELVSELEEKKLNSNELLEHKVKDMIKLQEDLTSLKKVYDESCGKVESLESNVKVLNVNLLENNLKMSLDQSKNNAQSQDTVKQLTENVEKLETIIFDKENVIKNATNDLENIEKAKDLLETQKEDLLKKVDNKTSKIEEFEKITAEDAVKIKELQEKVEMEIVHKRRQETLIKQIKEDNEKMRLTFENKIYTKEEFEKKVELRVKKIEEYQKKMEEKNDFLEKREVTNKINEENLTIEMIKLHKELSVAREESVKLNIDLEEERSKLEVLRSELEEVRFLLENERKNLKVESAEVVKLAQVVGEKEVLLKKYVDVMKKQKELLKQNKQLIDDKINEKQLNSVSENERILESLKITLGLEDKKNIEKKINDMINDFDETQKEMANVKNDLKIQLDAQKSVIMSFENENKSLLLCNSKRQSDEVVVDLKKEIDEMKKRLEKDGKLFTATKQKFETENSQQKSEIENSKLNIKSLKEKLIIYEEIERNLKQEIASLNTEKERLNDGVAAIDELKRTIGSLKEDLLNKVKIISEIKSEREDECVKFNNLQNEIDKKKKELEIVKGENVLLKNQLEKEGMKESLPESMKIEFETLRKQSKKEEEELHTKLQEENMSLSEKLTSLKTEKEYFEKLFDECKSDLSKEIKKVELLREELQTLRNMKCEVEKTKEEMENSTKKFQKDLQKSKTNADKYKESVKILKYSEEKLKEQLKEDEMKILQLNKAIKEDKSEVTGQLKDLSDLITHLKEENERIVVVENEKRMTQEVTNKQALEEMKRQMAVEVEMERQEKEINASSNFSQFQDLKEQYQLLSNDLSSYESINTDLENNKKQIEKSNKNLKSEVASLSLENTENKKTISSLNEIIFNLKSDLCIQQQEQAALKSEVERFKSISEEGDMKDQIVKTGVSELEDRLEEIKEELKGSRVNEESLSEMNKKLLEHNNTLLQSNDHLYEQINNLNNVETSDETEAITNLKKEIFILKSELKMLKDQKVDSAELDVKQQINNTHHHSAPSNNLQLQTNEDRIELLRLTTEKLGTKEQELSDFYQQYQELYQQFIGLQQLSTQSQQQMELLKTELSKHTSSSSSSSSLPPHHADKLVSIEDYKALECRLMQSHQDLSRIEMRLDTEIEKNNQLESSIQMMQQPNQRNNSINQPFSINMWSGDDDDNDSRIIPSSASLTEHVTYRCFQLKRRLLRCEQTKISFGTVYRYRSLLTNCLILYFIFLHLFLLRCFLF